MHQRTEATRGFYASLTPEQQKTFDAQTLPGFGPGGMHGGMHGHRAEAPADRTAPALPPARS